jgi:hypothetical protein
VYCITVCWRVIEYICLMMCEAYLPIIASHFYDVERDSLNCYGAKMKLPT